MPRAAISHLSSIEIPKETLVGNRGTQKTPLQNPLGNVIKNAINLYSDELKKKHAKLWKWHLESSQVK